MDIQNFIIGKIGIDKVLHFLAGGWVAAFAPNKLWWTALLIAIIIGFLKECFDYFIKKSTFDTVDWLATAAGGAVTALFMVYGLI